MITRMSVADAAANVRFLNSRRSISASGVRSPSQSRRWLGSGTSLGSTRRDSVSAAIAIGTLM
jgi:hypothetical protein